jgi:hypothetical protein
MYIAQRETYVLLDGTLAAIGRLSGAAPNPGTTQSSLVNTASAVKRTDCCAGVKAVCQPSPSAAAIQSRRSRGASA